MEKWKEIFVGQIPKACYQVRLMNGEQEGLVIELSSMKEKVRIKFGMVQGIRMLDEGIVQSKLYSDNEIELYRENNFQNVIYEIQEGEFIKLINQISNGYGALMDLKHYLIITQNYNIDIVAECEPIIEIF